MTKEEAIMCIKHEILINVNRKDLTGQAIGEALDMAIDALKCKPTVIRCEKLLSKEDFEAVVKRIHEDNQNVIPIPHEAEVVSTNISTNTSTNTSTKSTNISTDRPRSIEPTITVDLESGIIPRSAIEALPSTNK